MSAANGYWYPGTRLAVWPCGDVRLRELEASEGVALGVDVWAKGGRRLRRVARMSPAQARGIAALLADMADEAEGGGAA